MPEVGNNIRYIKGNISVPDFNVSPLFSTLLGIGDNGHGKDID